MRISGLFAAIALWGSAGTAGAISLEMAPPRVIDPATATVLPAETPDALLAELGITGPAVAEAEAARPTLGNIAAAGAPELPVPASLLFFAAGLAGIIAIHRRPGR